MGTGAGASCSRFIGDVLGTITCDFMENAVPCLAILSAGHANLGSPTTWDATWAWVDIGWPQGVVQLHGAGKILCYSRMGWHDMCCICMIWACCVFQLHGPHIAVLLLESWHLGLCLCMLGMTALQLFSVVHCGHSELVHVLDIALWHCCIEQHCVLSLSAQV